jgi:uncharacterized membrane protein YedE/YeeE
MQSVQQVASLTGWVLWAAFGLAVAFDAVAQVTHFCAMGAVADVVNMGDWTRARMWALAAAVAMIGFGLLSGLGWIDPSKAFYTAPRLRWLSAVVGGLMFGCGMVLGSGCGSKTLVRIGGGSLKSVLVFLLIAVSAFATLKGITGVWRVATVDRVGVDLTGGQDLPALLSRAQPLAHHAWSLGLGLGAGALLTAWVVSKAEGRQASTWLGGMGIGLVIVGMWWVSGWLGFVPEHPETLEPTYLASNSHGMESLSFVAPLAYTLDWLLLYSDASKVLTFGVVTPIGVVVGSALVAWRRGSFRWEGFGGAQDTAHHIVAGLLMGIGGVTALGCSIGQGLSGVSTLAVGSFIATAAIIAGAVLALRYQTWLVMREA